MIDMRSDTLAPVRPEIAQAWAKAATRPPAFGVREDPDERALIEEVADHFGLQSGVLVPTGTMANQIALMLHCSPGEGIVCDAGAHIATNEAQSTAGLANVAVTTVDGPRGHPTPDQLATLLEPWPSDKAARRLRLICLENTHNRAGGTVMTAGRVRQVVQLAHRSQVSVHIDGARIWNAVVTSNADAAALVDDADTLSVNLNKGLGAPLGSLLLGTQDAMKEAAALRRMLGGWWRPLGPVAAAARAALSDYRERLAEDHARARAFGEAIARETPDAVDFPETNIVMVRFPDPLKALDRLESQGVRTVDYGAGRTRFVFHGGHSDADAAHAADIIRTVLKEQR